ncbi:dihydrofolate reductase family protein [Microbacterium elymi]|uniref:Dihydrofolate reductase family protein n=1 Tax=Microbacterium elymi TaxID=2909587 RepID=A0ABY5NMB0_9MICO|nr:dihydrofolate reductase family protein [Microbacterium elymi]UUT36254.1 dihydrofolate reductase family protein [Microbacterium elymi]
MTGRILIDLFTTLDGVAQAPGAAEEDPSDGFGFGGWQAPLLDDTGGRLVTENMEGLDALLLGRRTYDIFAAYWPRHTDNPIGALFDRVPKYVASRGTPALGWQGSSLLGPDLRTEIDALRERHRNVHVIGSVDFAHSLLADELYDELVLWTYPVVLGGGKKVFPDGAVPAALRLVAPAVTTEKGMVQLRYAPAGAPTTGDMTLGD